MYKLPENSPIVGKECSICMEDFIANSTIARLPCLCYFHRAASTLGSRGDVNALFMPDRGRSLSYTFRRSPPQTSIAWHASSTPN